MLSSSTAVVNAEIEHVLVKIKEVARTQAQYKEFFIEEIENSNKLMTEILI
jgi:hypothetical protein